MIAIIVVALVLAMGLAGLRILWGPSLADRVVALDLAAAAAVGVLIAGFMRYGHTAFLDIAIGLALVTFVGTVAFASYLERSIET